MVADVVCVVVFCTIGRRSHAEGLTVAGIAETAWPFLAGHRWRRLAAGRGWRRPTAFVPTGGGRGCAPSWSECCCAEATSQGVAFSFIVVASLATAALLLGWRRWLRLFDAPRRLV